VGSSKGKPKRKDDLNKASSYYSQYLQHQEKVNQDPKSLVVPHWRKEKRNFLSRMSFYLNRARADFDDLIK
jgi:hypothetical protein